MKISIDGQDIGPSKPPYIIAELSANHNGSFERALESIKLAKDCGANAVKLQTYTPDTMTINCELPEFIVQGGLWDGYKLYDLYNWAQTPFEWHEKLFEFARQIGITLFSTPFDESAVDLLESLDCPAYKIASFELIDLPLIKCVASRGKPMIVSTGMASENEIEEAVATIREAGCNDILLLHCVSSYPAQVDQANILQVPELARRFDVLAGLSDHTLGTSVAVSAVALGACAIEKHFTLDRQDKGPDSEFSLEPPDLSQLCKDTFNAWKALGNTGYRRTKAELDNRIFRRSVYFVKDLAAGSIVSERDIRRIRPGLGLPPKYFDQLVGKKLRVDVKRGTATKWEQFDE